MIDLHAHTTASDGQHPPEELVQLAWQAGVRTLAVTDHDTVAALDAAVAAGRALGLEVIAGIELSAFVNGRETHILGHFVDPREPRLAGLSELLRGERLKRMEKMVARLEELGLPCPFEEVMRQSGGKNLGRPHLARAMVERGYVRDVKDAFDRYIGVGRPAYVERYKLQAGEAISLIRRAGGTATVAHAAVNQISREELAQLRDAGLAGLEIAHPDHPPEARAWLHAVARELDLVPTTGSDFHGELIVPGRRLGATEMKGEDLERLRARASRAEVGVDVQ